MTFRLGMGISKSFFTVYAQSDLATFSKSSLLCKLAWSDQTYDLRTKGGGDKMASQDRVKEN
jgi:hypothetical protein